MTMPLRILLILPVLVLGSCGTMRTEDFAGREPILVLEDYFAGKTRAWGIFEDRFGDLRREFVVDIDGTWDGRELTLDESFVYADGETDRRVWRIVRTGEHSYRGEAGDVVGPATGTLYGNAFNWRYELDLDVGERTVRVSFDDWMFLQPDGILINRAKVRKWGFEVGSVTVVFRKPDADAPHSEAGRGRPEQVRP